MWNRSIPDPPAAGPERELQHPDGQGPDPLQLEHDYNMHIDGEAGDRLPHHLPLLQVGQDVADSEWHLRIPKLKEEARTRYQHSTR